MLSGQNICGKVTLGCQTFHASILAAVTLLCLSEQGYGWQSNCEIGIIQFPNFNTMGGQIAYEIYKITVSEEFAKMNELTWTIMLSFCIQTRVPDKRLVDNLRGTVAWDYNSWAYRRLSCSSTRNFWKSTPIRQDELCYKHNMIEDWEEKFGEESTHAALSSSPLWRRRLSL